MAKTCRSAQYMTELFKLLRDKWLSVPQVVTELGMYHATAYRWMQELAANGMLRAQKGQRSTGARGGRRPMAYSLAPEWGGTAP